MESGAVSTEGRAANASGPEASLPRSRTRRDVAVCLLLGIVAFLIYNSNFRAISASDAFAARYLPLSIWRHRTLVLDPIVSSVGQGRKGPDTNPWIVRGRGDHFVSLYPVVVPVVVAPLYLPAVLYLDRTGWDPHTVDRVARIMEKLCASFLAAVSVMLVYLLLRRRCDRGTAVRLAFVFAFGTTTWVIGSQALWMHGLGQLSIAATLLLLTGPSSAWRAVAAGFFCALVACNRQPDAVLAAGLGLYGLWWAQRRAPLFVAAGLLPVGLVLAHNWHVVGHVAGAYALAYEPKHIRGDVLANVAGLLFSPTHGLFVFSPFLFFVPLGLPRALRDRSTRWLTAAIGGGVALQLILYGLFEDWRQGISFGPRWLTDMLPMLFWLLPPVVAGLSAAARVAFGLACCVAVAIQVVGAFWYTGVSDAGVLAAKGPDKMRAAWDARNASFIAELKHPPAPADLAVNVRGNIDAATVGNKGGGGEEPQLEIEGWTLVGNGSPTGVHVTIDGELTASTADFFERPDIVDALGESGPSGWQFALPARDLAPGEHVVAVLVQPYVDSESRLLQERTFTVAADNDADRRGRGLASAARRAAKVLAERQQSSGYWLTSFTDATRFEHPRREMNTYLNAVMIDVAGTVAERAGLTAMLGRAREFLASQIEADGLVRYHGRPDAPTIGKLGCAITPDSDDTALVWRVAPGEHSELLPAALATLARFRTPDGLYRTWLAPRERYECIDPGRDPNPADIGIQIHVFMLLAQADPPAAHALCAAMQKRAGDEDLWVYYKTAPPVVALRLAELRKAGCPLEVPQERLRNVVPGQEVWMEATQILERVDKAEDRCAAYGQAAELLHQLAADEFSLLARNPPLVYHNDLTGSVRRFYWSEEFGYALWLRLYFEGERARTALSCGGVGVPEGIVEP